MLSRLIEQFIDPSYDITLFDRFFNFEVRLIVEFMNE